MGSVNVSGLACRGKEIMKVLMIVNTDGALYVFRKPIIKKLIELGHEVISISSESRYFEWLKKLGVKPIALDFARHSVSPTQNFGLLIQLYRLIKRQQPDIVHSFTHKPAIYGTVGAWLAGVQGIFITITGLGTLFMRDDAKTKLMRWLLLLQYKFALRFATSVFFQNPDDMAYFISRKIIDPRKAVLTHGSGIDLEEFPCPSSSEVAHAKLSLGKELGVDLSGRKVVLFPARGVREKGFFEFYEAAKIVNRLEPDVYLFIHLGLVDSGSSSQITQGGIEQFSGECGVHYLGYKDNIQDYMKASDIVTLPSYSEGTPRSLLEALALGKVIVATDASGCRETLIDGWNGYLCKIGDAKSLTAKLLAVSEEFIMLSSLRSRQYCAMKFDATWLVDLTINSYFQDCEGIINEV
jgi:N,N'-diacetylbacillosaminyl-diphospho-undecaprenol alpha-1,3-N-acetylgalactosaminyltransferase